MGVLSGMRVVEGSAFVAVPLAGMTLAQMGADVIRFDRLEGGLDAGRWPVTKDGQSLFWAGLNKGKRSIAIDMKTPRAREIISEIITAPGEDAGLFITNLRVRGWMDYETLSARRPDLCMVTLMGDRHGRPAVDYTVNPSLGFPDATGPVGSTEPVAHVLPAWDCIAGNMVVTALLAAERKRLRQGQGSGVELSLKDVAAAMLGHLGIIGEVEINGVSREKSGNALYGAYGQDFLCADGQRVMVIGLTDRQWRGLLNVTGTREEMAALETRLGESLSDEGARWRHRDAITAILKPWFAARKVDDFATMFDEAGVTWSIFRDFATALAEDPDLSLANPMFSRLEQPGIGAYRVPGTPMSISGEAREAPVRAPLLGEHTEEILGDVAGLPDTEIAALFDAGIVAQAARSGDASRMAS
ncbi:MAG: mesaconyl-CoA C1-C4 CoA transferase [Rhodobacteraceae bacterium HLUCCO18]|nr:MAG: mesaconyl-CoA C1-C4 CoA transferase [Rhodobacteraceae bacterium HLUCCO18]